MATPNVLKGKDEQIAVAIAQPGATPVKVAMSFGVYPNSIREWLRRNNYVNVDGQWKPAGKTIRNVSPITKESR